ncbi:MAG: hypothetical protein J6F30_11740 [Cellulosilyticum sp.]|nr:hypothetical protein [Cellulosilyticum sp.]
MYVDTLITLQENLATYAVEGKKVTGHVTMNSPGMIKCYIQNLKGQSTGSEYALYAFSKAKDKGVRIGKLGKNKETKWMVSEKNVQNSGIKLEELDAVAIVAENDMRGADTIAMGFKSNRYIIVPMIDDIAKVIQGKQGYSAKDYTSTNSTNKKLVQPDPIVKGNNPISKNTSTSTTKYNLKEGNQYDGTCGQSNTTTSNTMGSGAGVGSNTQGTGTGMVSNTQGTGTSMGSNTMGTGTGVGSNKMGTGVSAGSNTMGTGVSAGSNTMGTGVNVGSNTMGTGTSIGGNTQGTGSGVSSNTIGIGDNTVGTGGEIEFEYISDGQNDQPISVNNNNAGATNQTIEQSDFTKQPLLGNVAQSIDAQASNNQAIDTQINNNQATDSQGNNIGESIEDTEAILIKIAQKLQELENNPAIIKGVNSGIPVSKGKANPASVVRDDDTPLDDITAKTSEELERIIARLKGDQTITNKIKEIEEQLTQIQNQDEEPVSSSRSNIEEKLESIYMEKQLEVQNDSDTRDLIIEAEKNEEIEVGVEPEMLNTSPRNALTFIKACMKEFKEKGFLAVEKNKKSIMGERKSVQDEVDYISEIDKKIKEIEERRKQERDKQ